MALRDPARRVVGVKQVTKQVNRGRAQAVFLATDAGPRVLGQLAQLCERMGVEVKTQMTIEELGAACGIQVGASAAAILETY